MREPGMFGRLIGKIREAELADSAEALKLGRIDQPDDQLSLTGIRVYANDIVDRIPVNAFRQAFVSWTCILRLF